MKQTQTKERVIPIEVVVDAQAVVAEWVLSTFGEESATNGPERTLRFVEEAVELAQAIRLDRETIHKLVDYVYDRPIGKAEQEVAGSLVTLYAAATALGIDANAVFDEELVRIRRPEVVERCRRRQAEKREALRNPQKTEA